MKDDPFYQTHRGGSGNIIVVNAMCLNGEEKIAVFGSVETASDWADKLPDDWICVFSPYVVDHPDFGNATKQ